MPSLHASRSHAGLLRAVAYLACTGAALHRPATAQILGGSSPVTVVTVRDAGGTPAPGAVVCIGTPGSPAAYGRAVTNQYGHAALRATLPPGPTTLSFTAHRDGYGVRSRRPYTSPAEPVGLSVELQLPSAKGGPACPDGRSGPTSGAGEAPRDLGRHAGTVPADRTAGRRAEGRPPLQRPPPGPVAALPGGSSPLRARLPPRATRRTYGRTRPSHTPIRHVSRTGSGTLQAHPRDGPQREA